MKDTPQRQPKKKAEAKKSQRKTGRPTMRTAAIDDRIVEGLAMGTPLTLICEPDDMPAWRTVYDWMAKDSELSAAIARAREVGFDRIAREALEIADTPQEGVETTDTPDGPRIKRGDMLGHRRLQVETRLKLLAKWDPKRYGEMMRSEISGPDGGPIQTIADRSTEEEEAFAERLARAQAKIQR